MANDNPGILERSLDYNRAYVNRITKSRRVRWIFAFSPKLQQLYSECGKVNTPARENAALAAVINAYEEGPVWRAFKWAFCAREDINIFLQQLGKRKTIDNSDRNKKDYYSVAVIVKNEARYIKEFILFYMATGADRIYIYDNDSTDDLLGTIEPFLISGFAVYRKWSGHTVQAAAYRDAVRKTRRRTTWLALVDADEFLFSLKGNMPEQLKVYEQYPGIGVNWLVFGPNGHNRRPEGFVMDNYTTTFADYDSAINCHIKSVVQPKEVFCVFHPHYAVYKGKGYAVSENGEAVDNYAMRAFSRRNHREIFRINHYCTKSLEDLEEKCKKGHADGSPNANYEDILRQINYSQIEDLAIRPYADLVRTWYEEY